MTKAGWEGRRKACEVVGGFTYAIDIVLYLWNACLAYSMHSWIVKKALLRHLYDRMQFLLLLSLLVALSLTSVPLSQKAFGATADVTCWLSDISMTSTPVLLNKLIILPLCWLFVGYLYSLTLAHIWQQPSSVSLTTPVTKSYQRLRRRLLLFALIFFLSWLLNSLWYFLLATDPASLPQSLPPFLVLGVIGKMYYAVGVLDALAYGYGSSSMGGFTFSCGRRMRRRLSEWWKRRVSWFKGEEVVEEEEEEEGKEGGGGGEGVGGGEVVVVPVRREGGGGGGRGRWGGGRRGGGGWGVLFLF